MAKRSKVKVIMVTLAESGEEKETVIKRCNTVEEAEQYVSDHEQDFADNPNVYSVYIEE